MLTHRSLPILLAFLAAVALRPQVASAGDEGALLPLGPFRIDMENPTSAVPSPEEAAKHPLEFGYFLMETSRFAELAEKDGEFARAAAFFEALALAVPEKAIAFRSACRNHESAGALDRALHSCRGALTREGATVGDHARFVHLVAAHPGDLPANADLVREANASIEAMRSDPEAELVSFRSQCELAVRLADAPKLTECRDVLLRDAPDEVSTIAYAWHAAMLERDFEAARAHIEQARALNVDDALLERMEATLTRAKADASVFAGLGGRPSLTLIALSSLVLLALGGWWSRGRTASAS